MHELSLILSMMDIAEDELQRVGHTGPVERLNLVVGALSGASAEALATAFTVAAPARGWTQARLAIERVPAVTVCSACERRCEVDGFVWDCPACGAPCRVEGGDELRLASIDVAG